MTLSAQTPFAMPDAPQARLSNGIVNATVYLPDARTGYYRGTRFDWAGVVGHLEFAGHNYYGPWFTKTDPSVADFVYRGADIVAGPCSAIVGPVEEFFTDGKALGFDEAAPGGTFIKIGVGVLRRPNKDDYSSYVLYDIVDAGKRTTQVHPDSVVFTQEVMDPSTGYGYRYEKTLRLVKDKPQMVIEHVLTNIGKRPIHSTVFDHNFLSIDHLPIGPDVHVTVPFNMQANKPTQTTPGAIQGHNIFYRRPLQGTESFEAQMGGFGASASDYDIKVENRRAGAGVQFTGDRPLVHLEIWSIRSVIAMEPFIGISINPGESFSWHYTYDYYKIP